MQDILSRLPPGFRFLPTDEELIRYYLHRKVHGRLTPEEADVIKLCNLYGEGARPPCEIFKLAGHKGGDDALYFFTILIKKTLNSSTQRMSRTVGTDGGTWHGDGVEEVICRLDNTEFKGTKRRFRYQNKQRPDQHGCWTLLEYGSESISENVVICKLKISDHGLKESRKRKSMDSSEVIQRTVNIDAVINSGPTMAQSAHDQEPRLLIQNQEMLPLVGTVSNEDNGGFSATGDTFYSIQNMGLEAPAIGNIEPVLPFQPQQANFIQEPTIGEHQQMASESFNEHPIISFEPIMLLSEESNIIENQGIMGLADISTEDYFENAAANVNFETMTSANENQQMEPASYNGGERVCPAGDNAVTPENAAPAVSAIPALEDDMLETLMNDTYWLENLQAMPREEEDS
ncbi:hypothetical protein POPTR_006G028300v4 [Populus trichocarpa]|uniref:Uncharacterized protein n=1 Tax=Populus trichocarpa TaxID=3694 RepID=U7DVR4_POPTR|nr:hypothetical protein POPTR_006G028300v4 [Populus trichocarpa]